MDVEAETLPGRDGAAAEVLRCLVQRAQLRRPSVLALVAQVEGSAYVEPGTLLLFGEEGRLRGWLSGGCLERHLEERALDLVRTGARGEWIELDQRDDDALLAPSASGCRGLIRVLLLGTRSSADCAGLAGRWLSREAGWQVAFATDGRAEIRCAEQVVGVDGPALPWSGPTPPPLQIPPPSRVILLGAGAETPLLVPQLRALGWRVEACEQRPRWLPLVDGVDRLVEAAPEAGIARLAPEAADAVLVMHHDFERDRCALAALAPLTPRWIGLLGPRRRRDDLLKLLGDAAAQRLLPRLEAPVGLDLGGKGPAAIALSIAASLQRQRHAG